MNKLGSKQKQLRRKSGKTKINAIAKTNTKISHRKIKNIITNIKNICGEKDRQKTEPDSTSHHNLHAVRSDDSVIYVGTFNTPPIIDLTSCSSTLITDQQLQPEEHTKKIKKNLQPCKHFKQKQGCTNNNNTKFLTSKSLINLHTNKCKDSSLPKQLSVSITSFLMSKYQGQKLKILDLPPNELEEAILQKVDKNKIKNCTSLNSCDNEVMDMILDMEEKYKIPQDPLSTEAPLK